MEVDLRLMRYVLAVAEEQSFSAAARRLHMAQPPLSRQIRDLEHRLGTPLFERRPVRLTEAGAVFVKGAREILTRTDRLVERTVLAGRGELGTARVGYVLSAAYDTLPRLIAAARDRHPALRVQAREGWSPDLDAALSDGEVDLVLSHTVPDRPGYARQPLRREAFWALVDARHPFAGRTGVALRDFAGQTFYFYSPHLAPAHYALLRAALDQTGEAFAWREDPIPGLRHPRLDDRASFTLVPASMARALASADIAAVPLTDPGLPTFDLDIVWRRDHLPPAAALLLATASVLTRNAHWT
ncbi:transcriptional regulator, LysR family protein [Actinomadura sp. NBRC 104425]|uniref:LysR family transcriptional regulator n=1 Tax=Actinomadura sp. NBRC 104425 TaxID=3032204 RepID=UPI0024A32D25|nr:LysR substrate-binding domain-containing protein [Actinomadura sp. NBRC 104425]GLZ11653.1 transcriptional regulator, LysR family protein [Actinomadura sp. NBRC 104425]